MSADEKTHIESLRYELMRAQETIRELQARIAQLEKELGRYSLV